MTQDELKSYPFEFYWRNEMRLEHARRALLYAKNNKTLKEFSRDVGCSSATAKKSYNKVCRQIYWHLRHKYRDLFTDDFIEKLYEAQMKCEDGVSLLDNFFNRMQELDETETKRNILDVEEKIKSPEQVYYEKLDKVIERMNAKRQKMIETINKDFDLLDKWLQDLK